MQKFTRYFYESEAINFSPFDGRKFLFSTRSGLSILLVNQYLDKLKNNDFSQIPEEIIQKMIKYKIIIPSEEDEFQEILKENQSAKNNDDVLSLTIQPTANCQFGCYYCGQEHSNHYMDERVEKFYLHRIEHHLIHAEGRYKKIGITWYGGEPLLGINVIRRFSQKIRFLCRKYDLKYCSDMVTNGFLLKKNTFLELLSKYKITSYQITLDGTSLTHDKRRTLKNNGGPTFDVIYQNIKEIVSCPEYVEQNASIQIRINIDRTNFSEVNGLMSKLISDKISDKVYLSFAPIEDWGGNTAGQTSFSHKQFSLLYVKWMKFCFKHDIKTGTLLPKRNFSACMVGSEHNEVLDAFGNIYPCWEFPYSAYKGKEHMIASAVMETQDDNEKATLLDTSDKIKQGVYECSKCVFFPLCAGGCPLALFEGRNACPNYKYDLTMRLIIDYQIRNKRDQLLKL